MFVIRQSILLPTLAILTTLGGCSAIESPYSKEPTYLKGERGSYNIGQMTDRDSSTCGEKGDGCRVLGKVVLTKPYDNVSFQIARASRIAGEPPQYVTCASPAEAAKMVGTSGSVSISGSMKVAGAAAPVAASASEAMNQAATLLQSQDSATHFVATAAFVNCLAYASGMYESDKAAELQGQILRYAVSIAAGASAPQK